MIGKVRRAAIGIAHDRLLERFGKPPAHDVVIGHSREQRAIGAIEMGTGDVRVVFVAGIHGNEVGTVKVAHHLALWLRREPTYLARFTFTIIPCLNPDGFHQSRRNRDYVNGGLIGRFNAFDVDLNRNFPVKTFKMHSTWGRGKRYRDKINVYCGDRGGSEPETRSLIEYVTAFKPHLYVSFHNAAGDVMGSDDERAQKLTEAFAHASGYHRESQQDWEALDQTGTAKEWCEKIEVPYVEIEGRYRWGADWASHQRGLKAMLGALLTDR